MKDDVAPCRGCGMPVRWVRTTTGKAMPLDPDPDPDGNVLLTDAGAVVLGGQRQLVLRLDDAGGAELWMTHFATCGDVESFR